VSELRLVCLHGLGRAPSDWDAVRDRLRAYGTVVTPVLPRRSSAATAVATRAVAPGAVVIGHSMGGIVALQIARTTAPAVPLGRASECQLAVPPAVGGVILTGCPFPVARNGRTRHATALDYAGHRVAFVRSLGDRPRVAVPHRRSPAGLGGVARVLARPGRFHTLFGAVEAPVLVVHAADDHHVPLDFALAAAARNGWAVRVLDAGGHHAHIRAPAAWTAAVEPWLAALAATR
jgi:pimeloyl-ACP methyl ester carboxylesterase